MLGDVELSLVQEILTGERQALAIHPVPGLAGSYTQSLNRQSVQVSLRGVMSGDDALNGLETLRRKFHEGEPLSFAADIMTATQVQQVLIDALNVRELAGKPNQFEYRLMLKEYVPPPPDEAAGQRGVDQEVADEASQRQAEQERQVEGGLATLEVTVDEDLRDSLESVEVVGRDADGREVRRELTATGEDLYVFENLPLGEYSVTGRRRQG